MSIPRFAAHLLLPALTLALLAAPAGVSNADTAPVDTATTSAAPPEDAGGVVEWAIEPSSVGGPAGRDYFVWNVAPGNELIDWARIHNYGDASLTVDVYATDAVLTPDNNFSLLPAAQPPLDLGNRIGFDVTKVTIEPGQAVDVPFKLTVPSDMTPGDHQGGIIASVSTPALDNGEGGTVLVDRRVAARIYLRVDGPLSPALQISNIQTEFRAGENPFGGGTTDVTYSLTNTGNVRLGGSATAEVSGPFGWFAKDAVLSDIPPLFPGETRTITQQVSGVMAVGPMSAAVSVLPVISPDPGGPAIAAVGNDASFWAAGLLFWIVVGLLALILLFIAYRVVRRLRRRSKARKAAAGPLDSDSSTGTAADEQRDSVTPDSAHTTETPVSVGSASSSSSAESL